MGSFGAVLVLDIGHSSLLAGCPVPCKSNHRCIRPADPELEHGCVGVGAAVRGPWGPMPAINCSSSGVWLDILLFLFVAVITWYLKFFSSDEFDERLTRRVLCEARPISHPESGLTTDKPVTGTV